VEVTPPSAPPSAPSASESPRAILRECLLVFLVSTVAVFLLGRLVAVVPRLEDLLPALVAIVFLYLPATMAWRRGEELSQWGLTTHPRGKSALLGLGLPVLVVFPLFLVVFVTFYRTTCAHDAPHLIAQLAPPGFCRRFLGWAGLSHPRLPRDWLSTTFAQIVVVALPEELFFRGWLLGRLEQALPPRHRVLGGGIGWALLLSAALFALGHVLVVFDARRLVVFFPGLLFGWMRSATGSVAAGVTCHAAANLYIDTLHRTFFR
jgi:hypothetical protein